MCVCELVNKRHRRFLCQRRSMDRKLWIPPHVDGGAVAMGVSGRRGMYIFDSTRVRA